MSVCNALLDSGYLIETKDMELQTAKTQIRHYPRYWNATYSIFIRVKDSTTYIWSTFTAPPGGGLFMNERTKYRTNRKGEPLQKSIDGYIFLLVNEFAKSLNGQISYTNQ